MHPLLAFAAAHKGALLWAALVLVSVVNSQLPYAAMRDGPLLKRLVGLLLDALSAAVRRDSPGSLALPLVQLSQPPADRPRLAIVPLPPAPTEPDPHA